MAIKLEVKNLYKIFGEHPQRAFKYIEKGLSKEQILGYCIKRNFWGNGYATEAAKAVLEYMFNEVGLNRIEASHSVNNKASGRVLEKVGMILEGCAKEYYYSNIGFQDSNLYALTRGEYIKVKKEY